MTFGQRILVIVHSIGAFAQKIFDKAGSELKTTIIPAGIAIGNVLKTITTVDSGDLIGGLVGVAGKAWEDKIRTAVNNVIPKLQIAQQFLSLTDNNAILAAVVRLVGTSVDSVKAAFYTEISAKVIEDLADGKITIGEAYALAQIVFPQIPTITTVPHPDTPVDPTAPLDTEANKTLQPAA